MTTQQTQIDELEAMQERALQHDITLTDPTGRELTIDELRPQVENAEQAQEQMTPEEREFEKAKQNAKRAEEQAKAEANSGGQRSIPDPLLPPSLTSNAPPSRARRVRPEDLASRGPRNVSHELAQKLGFDKPTDDDIELAKQHDYPVIIPGAKAYVADIDIRCALGGGIRPAGSVILLTDAHAKNKLEYLTPVEDVPEEHVLPVAGRNAPVQPAATQSPAAQRAAAPKGAKAQASGKGKSGK